MKSLKSSWKICLAITTSFVLGVVISNTSPVKASPQEQGSVHVFIAPLEVATAKETRSQNLPGGRVVGISCIPKPTDKLPDHAICYVATGPQ